MGRHALVHIQHAMTIYAAMPNLCLQAGCTCCLLLSLGFLVACAEAFPQYRSLLEESSDFDLDYEDDYDDRRILAELLPGQSRDTYIHDGA